VAASLSTGTVLATAAVLTVVLTGAVVMVPSVTGLRAPGPA
jgi:hypothetical protein